MFFAFFFFLTTFYGKILVGAMIPFYPGNRVGLVAACDPRRFFAFFASVSAQECTHGPVEDTHHPSV